MIKSMTGFSKIELNEGGYIVTLEIKSLNGRYLEYNCRMPKHLQHKELELREIIRQNIQRGTISLNLYVEMIQTDQPFELNLDQAAKCYYTLNELRKILKLKEAVKLENVLHFSDSFRKVDDVIDEETQMNLVKKALREALKSLDNMRKREGQTITKDIMNRIKKVSDITAKLEQIGGERIPQEREKMRIRIAQLFESDEFDEQRIALEMVILADKLDISEEVVRLKSHLKFFNDTIKGNEPPGRKINFLLQEMNREVNTIGSKINDATASQLVVAAKDELERIREQVQNIE